MQHKKMLLPQFIELQAQEKKEKREEPFDKKSSKPPLEFLLIRLPITVHMTELTIAGL
jgi:hypothetical protein